MSKREIPFEEMDSNGMFGHLMDMSSEKTKWNRDVAIKLLEEADWLEDLATKYRHLAAVMVLEAQEFGQMAADHLTMEFPMSDEEATDIE